MDRRLAWTILSDAAKAPSRTLERLRAGRTAEKVFAIGFNKSGTTSLHEIFQKLGYHSYHGIKWRDVSKPAIYYFYDAFCDDIPSDFRRLDAKFPNAKFLLQVRSLDAWLDSRLEHIRRLPPGKKRHPNWSMKESSVQIWTRLWNEHHIEVLRYFRDRPDDLLLLNYIREPDAANRIAAFLGRAERLDKPHANANPDADAGRTLKHRGMITAALNGLGIPESEWGNDIHCPSISGVDPAEIPVDTVRGASAMGQTGTAAPRSGL